MLHLLKKTRAWMEDRFGIDAVREKVLDRRVPKVPWYFGDGSTLLLLLGVQVATGMLMTLTYSPSPDTAYQSVLYITTQQTMGWFIRGLHYWSAGMMMIMLFFHVFRQLLVGGYKSPREGTWLIGVAMFFLVLIMSYTGYVLRWDERAVYAMQVSLHMFYRVPWIGEHIVVFVQGGPIMGAQTLTRIYGVHVIIVPLLLLGLAGWHMFLVVYHGTTAWTEQKVPVKDAEEQRRIYKADKESDEHGEVFHPHTTFQSGVMALIIFAIAVVLTVVFGPAELYPEANFVEQSIPAEEWWYWWYSGLIALLPPVVAPWFYVLFPVTVLIAMVLLPFIDRSPRRGIRNRPIWAVFVAICAIALLALTDYRRRSPFTGSPSPQPPPVPAGVELTADVERGRQLFARYGCNSCHAIADHGPMVGPDLARIGGRMSHAELRQYILRPPAEVPMPPYEGRVSDEELDRLADFVLVAQTFPREQR
jgi:ubiquinol-cytochrome c reductase cytochrome b subunit